MMLTDTEWLRFVTFAFVAAGIVGSATTGAFLINGLTLTQAVAGSAVWCGAIAVVLHLTMRWLLRRETGTETTSESTEDTA